MYGLGNSSEIGGVMALKGKGKRAIQEFVDNGTEFTHETTKGLKYENWSQVPKGRLAQSQLNYNNYIESKANHPVWVLFSYNTPIAWKFDGEQDWVIPEIYYSLTTTNHQNVTRTAADNPGFYKNSKY